MREQELDEKFITEMLHSIFQLAEKIGLQDLVTKIIVEQLGKYDARFLQLKLF